MSFYHNPDDDKWLIRPMTDWDSKNNKRVKLIPLDEAPFEVLRRKILGPVLFVEDYIKQCKEVFSKEK